MIDVIKQKFREEVTDFHAYKKLERSLDSKIMTGKFSPEFSLGELYFSNAVPEQLHG